MQQPCSSLAAPTADQPPACALHTRRVLELLPTPLPGLHSPAALQPLLAWALQLTRSPRVREIDAGARLLRLLLVKYVLGLRWRLVLHPAPRAEAPAGACNGDAAAAAAGGGGADAGALLQLLSGLTGRLRVQLAAAQADMAAASRHGLVHGVVLCLRYAVEVVPWAQLTTQPCSCSVGVSAAAACAGLQQQACDSGDAAVLVVKGPASSVARAWCTDLLALLEGVAALVKPLLSAQVGVA